MQQSQFGLYDIVRFTGSEHPGETAVVWDITDDAEQNIVYQVRDTHAVLHTAFEHKLEATGKSASPLLYDEEVEIYPQDIITEPDVVTLTGSKGTIVGIAFDEAESQ